MMITVISVAAFLIRLIGLNQSLWLDEATAAKVVKSFNYLSIIQKFSPGDFHPPLYYLFLKFWTNFFGYSEISLRMPSVIFSLLTGCIIYLIGRKLKGEKVGIWAAVFFLFNPLIVYYSQEARMYMLATFLLVVAFYYLTKITEKPQAQSSKLKAQNYKDLILFITFSILSFGMFYGAVFFITAIFVLMLIKKQYKMFIVSCFTFIVTVLLISPLLYRQLINSRQALTMVVNWKLVLGQTNIKNLLLIPLKFSFGRISFYPKYIYYFLAGLWSMFVSYFVYKGSFKNKHLSLLLVIPILLGLIFSFYSPLLQYFRFLYLIPIMSLLLSLGVNKNWQRMLLLIGFLTLSLVYLSIPKFHREDWKNLAKSLPSNQNVYMIESSSDALKYYIDNFKINELTSLANYMDKAKELVVIPYTSEIHGIDYKNILNKGGYKLKKITTFRELTFEEWQRELDR